LSELVGEHRNSNDVIKEIVEYIKSNPGCTKKKLMSVFGWGCSSMGKRLIELKKEGVIFGKLERTHRNGNSIFYYIK